MIKENTPLLSILTILVKLSSVLRLALLISIPFLLSFIANGLYTWIESNASLIDSFLNLSDLIKKMTIFIDLQAILKNMTFALLISLLTKIGIYIYIVCFSLLIAFRPKWFRNSLLNSRLAFVLYGLAEIGFITIVLGWLGNVNSIAYPPIDPGLGGLFESVLTPFGEIKDVILMAKRTNTVLILTLITSALTLALSSYHFYKLEKKVRET